MTAKALLAPTALGACGVVEDPAGRVLVCRHSYMSGWMLPGGGVGRETPKTALLRELGEEIGLIEAEEPQFLGVYTRRAGWATNVVLLYRLKNARIDFKPNLEVRAIQFIDPLKPPAGTAEGTLRRLAEIYGGAAPSPYW